MSTLQSLFPSNWGEKQPKSLVDLLEADYDDLDVTAKALRQMTVQVVHSYERTPILTANIALHLIEKHHLPVRRGRWTTVVLDNKRERVYNRGQGTTMRLAHTVSTIFPKYENLVTKAPLPVGGQYLIICGGTLESLSDENLTKYQQLVKMTAVADVLLWDEQDHVATFWSVKAGHGRRGNDTINFPDQNLLRRWQNDNSCNESA